MSEFKDKYDLVIVGGGPSGLSAAIYAGREGMDTVVVDKAIFGGMAAVTEGIENYPGFRDGIGGQELIDEMKAQSERFGAQSAPFSEVTNIEAGPDGCVVDIEGTKVRAHAVLIATGSTYRKLDVPGEVELTGRGVHYCATCDGPLYRDKNLVTIGGGNSALQETLFLARFAKHIDMYVRGDAFRGSDVLIKELEAEPNITVHFNTKTTELTKPEPRGPISLTVQTGDEAPRTEEADGVFIFVGLLPNTDHMKNFHVDDRGFIITDAKFQTHLQGVFVSGDVRSGSTWQIASAVGEGVSAALEIRAYLDQRYPEWHRRASERTTADKPAAV